MSKQEQISRNHHFVPQFYLRAWHDSDGDGLWLYNRNSNSHISLHRRPAKSVAHSYDLYSLMPDKLHPGIKSISDELEKNILTPIDDASALVHKKLLKHGLRALTEEDKAIWAIFLNSLMERTPQRIKEIELGVHSELGDSHKKLLTDFEHNCRSPYMKEFIKKVDLNKAARNAILFAMVRYIFEWPVIECISKMVWKTIDIPDGPDHFLTSDSPLLINCGKSESPIYVLSIALSPKRLLILHKDTEEFDREFIAMLAITHNITVTQKAEKYLVSSRKLKDSNYVKYTKLPEQLPNTNSLA